MAKPNADEIKENIQVVDGKIWNKALQRPEGLDLFETDLSNAIAAAWSEVNDAFSIASVPVTGGSSSPGGPLEEGEAILSPGMLTNSSSFASIEADFSSSFANVTEGLSKLVKAIALGIDQNFSLWLIGYSCTLVASGGSCSWTAAPSTSPGPWVGGSIQSVSINKGASSGDSSMTAIGLEISIKNIADPSILKQNQNTFQPALSDLIEAVAKGFHMTWKQWKTNTQVSGGTGSGMASPPNGSVIGTVISPLVS